MKPTLHGWRERRGAGAERSSFPECAAPRLLWKARCTWNATGPRAQPCHPSSLAQSQRCLATTGACPRAGRLSPACEGSPHRPCFQPPSHRPAAAPAAIEADGSGGAARAPRLPRQQRWQRIPPRRQWPTPIQVCCYCRCCCCCCRCRCRCRCRCHCRCWAPGRCWTEAGCTGPSCSLHAQAPSRLQHSRARTRLA